MAFRTQLKMQSIDASTGDLKNTTLGYIGNIPDSDLSTAAATIDTAVRSFATLFTDSYSDTLLIETSSISEILAD